MASHRRLILLRLLSDYGMLLVLLLLCLFLSIWTYGEEHPTGAAAGDDFARRIQSAFPAESRVLIVTLDNDEDRAFAEAAESRLRSHGLTVVNSINGDPRDVRQWLEQDRQRPAIDVIACVHATAQWAFWDGLSHEFQHVGTPKVVSPKPYHWPSFLKAQNLINVADQIVVIAIIAIGMTLVILTAGIDLSVGSLIALAAVTATWLIRAVGQTPYADWGQSTLGMIACSLVAIVACGLFGLLAGGLITAFRMPPFIVTLAIMLIVRGLAQMIAKGQSIFEIPDSFQWLGKDSFTFSGLPAWCTLPHDVALMMVLYLAAHVLLTRTVLGRHIYAVGGNAEAARLSGVPVQRILLFVYTVCGLLAGLGGVVMASQLNSGKGTFGTTYELYVIAAVVVGGTSLFGGEGKIFGTLIGAFVIAVIRNGMNLMGIESYSQLVVLGLVILGAVLLDQGKKRWWMQLRSS